MPKFGIRKYFRKKLGGSSKKASQQNQRETLKPSGAANIGNRSRRAFYGGKLEPGTVATPELMAEYTVAAQKRNAGLAQYDIDLEKTQEPEEAEATGGLAGLARKLNNSKKSGARGRSSLFFDSVEQNLESVLGQMDKNLGEDEDQNRDILTQTMLDYTNLITACRVYLERSAISANVQARQNIVREIMALAQADLQSIRGYGDTHANESAEQRPKTIREMMEKGRRRVIELKDDRKEEELQHVGGAVSYIARVKKEDVKGDSPRGYYKDEDIYTRKTGLEVAMDTIRLVRDRGKKIAPDIYKSIEEAIEEASVKLTGVDENMARVGIIDEVQKMIPEYKSNREVREFLDTCRNAVCANQSISNFTGGDGFLMMNLKMGDSINISRRNVATSRVANLLGIGDLIAQSEIADIQYKDGEGNIKTKTGNLMQEAKGIEARQYQMDSMREEFLKKEKEKPGGGQERSLSGMDDKVSGEFLRSLTSLQVLDNLVGQIDRHPGNYMIDKRKDGKLGRVQGIDNDLSFGHGVFFGKPNGSNNKGISIINLANNITEEKAHEAELRLRYMDRKLAQRILALREADVRMVLADVLEQRAIDAFWKRVHVVQIALQKQDLEGDHFLDGDESWEKEEVKKYFLNSGEETVAGNFFRRAKGGFGSTSIAGDLNAEYKMNLAVEVLEGERNKGKEGAFATPERAVQFFKEYGVTTEIIEYLQATKQLDGNPAILKQFEQSVLANKIATKEIAKKKEALEKTK